MLGALENRAAQVRLAAAFVGGSLAAQWLYLGAGPDSTSMRAAFAIESAYFFVLATVLVAGSDAGNESIALWALGFVGIAAGTLARAIYDSAIGAADHNLLPFEVIFIAAFALPGAVLGTIVGSVLRYLRRRTPRATAKIQP